MQRNKLDDPFSYVIILNSFFAAVNLAKENVDENSAILGLMCASSCLVLMSVSCFRKGKKKEKFNFD